MRWSRWNMKHRPWKPDRLRLSGPVTCSPKFRDIAKRSSELAQNIASAASEQNFIDGKVGRAIKEFTGGAVATQKQTDSTRLTIEDMAKLAEGLNSSVAQFKLA